MELQPRTQPGNAPARPRPGSLAPVFVPLDVGAENEAGVRHWDGFDELASHLASTGVTVWIHQRGPFHFDIRTWIEPAGGEKRGRENGGEGSGSGAKKASSNRRCWSKVRRTQESMDAMLEAAWGLITYEGKLLMGRTEFLVGEGGFWKDLGKDVFYDEKLPLVKLLNSDHQLVRRWKVGLRSNREVVHVALCCAKTLSPTCEEGVTAWTAYWTWVDHCMVTSMDPRASPEVRQQARRVVTLLAPSHRLQTEVLAICMQSASISSPAASEAICMIEEGMPACPLAFPAPA